MALLFIVRSTIIQRILLALIMGGLIFVFRDRVFYAFGIGVAILVVAVFVLDWVVRGCRIFTLVRHCNYYLGAITFGLAIFGILAFFVPSKGVFSTTSLGGQLGLWVIVNQNIAGALRIAALVIVGIIFITPRHSWRAMVSLVEWLWHGISWVYRFCAEHSPHRTIPEWFRKRQASRLQNKKPSHLRFNQSESLTKVSGRQPGLKTNGYQLSMEEESQKESFNTYAIPHSQGRWQLPPVSLFDRPLAIAYSEAEVERRARMIEDALASYGVEAKVVQANVGPTVTQFGVDPGWERKYRQIKERTKNGDIIMRQEEVSRRRVKIERISSLANNLALALSAPSVRIEAPIPGTSMVGIETPNMSVGITSFREAIESPAYQRMSAYSKLAIVLGKGTSGEIVVEELAKMPHLLIAGATGSGKSVCLNTIIASLIMNTSPEELKFLMIDPKRVELVYYNSLPHLRSSVVVENDRAIDILTWLNQEMDDRYRKMNQTRTRNIESYNRSRRVTVPMPYLVLIIDELADLMMTKGTEVEPLLCRLAQMGRATGIHLVVATQRPSVDVVTGLIKANFPTRISFAVTSQVDSRTILDGAGAEKLLGRGDMLYLPTGAPKPKRLQGCYISDDEIGKLVSFWSKQVPTQPSPSKTPSVSAEAGVTDVTHPYTESKVDADEDTSTHAPQ